MTMEIRTSASRLPTGTWVKVYGFRRPSDLWNKAGQYFSGLVSSVDTDVDRKLQTIVTFSDGTKVHAANYAVAYVQHADALDPGERNPYDSATGEFIARCVCGREFRDAGEPFAADIRMMEHVQDPDLTDDEIESRLAA